MWMSGRRSYVTAAQFLQIKSVFGEIHIYFLSGKKPPHMQ